MSGSSLDLSSSTEQRICAAARVLRISPDAFLQRLLAQHYNTLGGLPLELLRYILSFLDYSTISGLVARVSKFWQECVLESPQNFFSRLRQMHGIHLLDPVHGMFYFPRALKRVVFDTKGAAASISAGTSAAAAAAPPPPPPPPPARTLSPASAALHAAVPTIPASSFLTVDIRTQNTKSLPWGYVQVTVQRAIEQERTDYGAVRTPGLQRPEEPVWSQTATVTYDRRVYMFGGETYEGVVLDRAYEYDPMTKRWAVLPSLNEKRAAASAAAFRGRIFVFGGYNEEGEVLDTYEVLDVASRSWVSRHYPPSWVFEAPLSAAAPAGTTESAAAGGYGQCEGTKGTCMNSLSVNAASAWAEAAPSFYSGLLNAGRTATAAAGAAAGQYRMPEKICGTATTVYGDVIFFAGGHRSCIAPDQTAVSYSAVNSASTTPMHSVGRPHTGGPTSAMGTPSPAMGGGGGGSSSARSAHGSAALRSVAAAVGLMTSPVGTEPSSATLRGSTSAGFDGNTSPTEGAQPATTASHHFHNNNNNPYATANVIEGAGAPTDSPRRLPRVNSIGIDGPASAEALVWVFSPLTGQWWRHGPRLPSPRAFGALTVLELPVLGPTLCYFGGCARADAPETAMFYIPLRDEQSTRVVRPPLQRDEEDEKGEGETRRGGSGDCDDGGTRSPTAESSPPTPLMQGEPKRSEAAQGRLPAELTTTFLRSAQDPWLASMQPSAAQTPTESVSALRAVPARRGVAGGDYTAVRPPHPASPLACATAPTAARAIFSNAPPHTPTQCDSASTLLSAELDYGTRLDTTQPPADSSPREPAVDMIARCFRDPEELPWQRYVRIPIGGAFTSVAVVGCPHSRTVVLTGFYPAPNIGFCKVSRLLPPDALTPLLGALTPSPPPPPPAAGMRTPPLQSSRPGSGALRYAPRAANPPPLRLDAALPDDVEAAAAAQHFHQEREWSHHQRQEVREMVRSAARAATLRHPRNPQTAGEEQKWSLAPVPEVRVRNPTGPALTRVSWKVQSLNAKVIVGIE